MGAMFCLSGPNRLRVPTWGIIEFTGEQQYPYWLRVHYPEGESFCVHCEV